MTEEEVCLKCFLELPRTAYIQRPEDNSLAGIFKLQVNIHKAVSFMRYLKNSDSSGLVKAIKYKKGVTLGRYMGRIVAEEFLTVSPVFFDDIDVIVPMPLTKARYRQRGYNQSELIAEGLSEVTGVPVDRDAVARLFFNVSQTQLTTHERRENVKRVFQCVHPERLGGKHVLLIDDVLTTGSTLLALAKSIDDVVENVSFSVLVLASAGETTHI